MWRSLWGNVGNIQNEILLVRCLILFMYHSTDFCNLVLASIKSFSEWKTRQPEKKRIIPKKVVESLLFFFTFIAAYFEVALAWREACEWQHPDWIYFDKT